MGRIWGPGGWLQHHADRRWFRFLMVFMLGTLSLFLLGYFGWSDSRMAHRVIPSLAYAIPGGVFLGLGMLAFDAWEARIRRRAERE